MIISFKGLDMYNYLHVVSNFTYYDYSDNYFKKYGHNSLLEIMNDRISRIKIANKILYKIYLINKYDNRIYKLKMNSVEIGKLYNSNEYNLYFSYINYKNRLKWFDETYYTYSSNSYDILFEGRRYNGFEFYDKFLFNIFGPVYLI